MRKDFLNVSTLTGNLEKIRARLRDKFFSHIYSPITYTSGISIKRATPRAIRAVAFFSGR